MEKEFDKDDEVKESSKGNPKQSKKGNKSRRKPGSTGKKSYRGHIKSDKSSDNDRTWYSRNSETLNNVGSWPFGSPLGLKVGYDSFGFQTSSGLNNLSVVPGIMSIDFDATLGLSADSTSPVNVAAQAIYSYVRNKNNKANLSYDRADIIITLGAISNFFMMWNYGKRAYDCSTTRSPMNRYKPEYLVKAMGFNYDDITSNAPNFRFKLNNLADRMGTLGVPANIPLFTRQSWLTSNVFCDSSSDKAQMYLFNPAGYYVYDEMSNPKGSQLVYHQIRPNSADDLLTSEELIQILTEQLKALLDSTDIGNISADLAHAYGDIYAQLGHITEDEVLIPSYNEEVLTQIHACTPMPEPYAASLAQVLPTWNITQDPDTLNVIYQPQWVKVNEPSTGWTTANYEAVEQCVPYCAPALLNSRFDNPSPSDVMVATRLISRLSIDAQLGENASQDWTVKVESMGTEIVRRVNIWTLSYNPDDTTSAGHSPAYLRRTFQGAFKIAKNPNHSSAFALVKELMAYTSFDWSPVQVMYEPSANMGTVNTFSDWLKYVALSGALCDMNNYTLLPLQNLQNLHLLATENLLGLDF